jgi:hypothetical protein
MIVFSREAPLDKEKFRKRYHAEIDSNYRPVRNSANRYRQDRDEMDRRTYSGMGAFFCEHDLFATESMGPLCDRTPEHLGVTDIAIIGARQLLLDSIDRVRQGREPLHVVRDQGKNRFPHLVVLSEVINRTPDWKTHWTTKVRNEVRA